MSRTTIAGAATELYNSLTVDDDGNPEQSLVDAGIVKVYPFEPGASGVAKPASITVMFSGWTPTEWRFQIRIYVTDTAPLVAQDIIQDTVTAVEALLKTGQAFGPDVGEIAWVDEIQAWVAMTESLVGREDGF